MTEPAAAAVFASVFLGMLAFWIVCALAIYIAISLAYMKLFEKAGHPAPWLAWIPVASLWPFFYCIRRSAWNVLWFLVPILAGPLLVNVGHGVGALIALILDVIVLVLVIVWWVQFLHAFAMSGWWMLLLLIPGIGFIAFLALMLYMGFSSRVAYVR